MTEVDIFYTNRPDIDDCAIDAPLFDLTKLTIKVAENKYHKTPFYELVIQDGQFQILALGGLFGDNNGSVNGFFGSSVPFWFDGAQATLHTPLQPVLSRNSIDTYETIARMDLLCLVDLSVIDSPTQNIKLLILYHIPQQTPLLIQLHILS